MIPAPHKDITFKSEPFATAKGFCFGRNERVYWTVKFTVPVAVAPPFELVAVTVTAEVPTGVPGLC